MADALALLYGVLRSFMLFLAALLFSWIGLTLLRPGEYQTTNLDKAPNQSTPIQLEQSSDESLEIYKELYMKLHNIEDYPDILSQARGKLIALFSSAILFKSRSEDPGILACSEYSPNDLETFLKCHQDKVFTKWEQYVRQRKDGSPRQMFKDRQGAIHWLKQIAPLKYVDGAWLGYINRVTTPFHFRGVVKIAWQIMSEEYGDGDLKKHHVYIYHKLMQGLAPELPGADSMAFTDPCHGLTDTSVWRAAVAQLLISLFPHEFLPELLGYNMHFETITLQTLVAAKELRELSIDPYYFNLHASIDNADTGHSAIGLYAVEQFLDKIEHSQGVQGKNQAWKRIQIGFILSEYLEQSVSGADAYQPGDKSLPSADIEKRFMSIIQAKCSASEKLHCSSGVKLGGRMLTEWLNPTFLSSRERQTEFIRCLSSASHWIHRGNSNTSRLVKELSWGGRMFGSFTSSEVDIVKSWIDTLDEEPQLYWSFSERPLAPIGEEVHNQNILKDYPVFSPLSVLGVRPHRHATRLLHPDAVRTSRLDIVTTVNMTKLLPLWFTHTCLLQSLISIPFKSTTLARCAILRFLRAQAGFGMESAGVAGMDEARRTDVVGILELGLEMAERAGLMVPQTLEEAIQAWPSEFAVTMLHLSTRANKNAGLLIGMSWAFVDLHDAIASYTCLSQESCSILRNISRRERESLAECVDELKCNDGAYRQTCQGYVWGRDEVQHCFGGVDSGSLDDRPIE